MTLNPLLASLLIFSFTLASQTLTINFSNIRSSVGSIQIQFFTSQENFDKEIPLFTKILSKSGMENGKLSVTYRGIPPGTYGVAILDDENNNQKMDYGFVLPKEGFGFSDYYHTGMTRPHFEKFSFALNKEPKKTEIKVRYL